MRVLLVDDEPPARERLSLLLDRAEEVSIVGECGDGWEAVEAIDRLGPDLVFLDVKMPQRDGFEVLSAIAPARLPEVIFVTAYDAFAVRAFQAHAVGYLLKPVQDELFWAAFERARARIATRGAVNENRRLLELLAQVASERLAEETMPNPPLIIGSGERYLERIAVKGADRVHFVRVADIDWLEASGNYVRLRAGRATHTVRETLASLEAKLDPGRFIRIHRRVIVSLDRVRELEPWFGGDQIVVLSDGAKLKVSRSYRERFLERLACAP